MNAQHFNAAVTFGRQLIRSGDLDPVYFALRALPEQQRLRTALAYFFLYHLGAAAFLGEREGTKFWDGLELAAANTDLSWPRGSERRHWRGTVARDCAGWLRANYEKPEQVIFSWYNRANTSHFSHISEQVKKTPACGPWIAFKVADVMERCLDLRVDFSDCNLGIYREPRAGAALLYFGDAEAAINNSQLDEVITTLLKALGPLKAPPHKDRRIGIAEAETCLCKYKSHVGGHYPPGKDLREVAHTLSDPRWGRTAERMRKALP
jgi:Alpha-glutamyl/putrescinyl thymine pyrophosphorylase clade 2